MKKSGLVIALFLFAACAIFGYLAASKSGFGSSSADTNSITASTALASSQQNYLLIQVDDLGSTSPQLVQVWIVLTYYSNPPQVIFLPLYPSYDTSQNSDIANSFSMNSSNQLTDKLSKKIASLYKVQVNGYIITDAAGENSIANWFGIAGIQPATTTAKTDDDKHAILLNSQTFFQNVCAQLISGGAANEYSSIQWSQIIPGHFQTNLSFEVLMASWDRVIRSSPPQQCEVLSKE